MSSEEEAEAPRGRRGGGPRQAGEEMDTMACLLEMM